MLKSVVLLALVLLSAPLAAAQSYPCETVRADAEYVACMQREYDRVDAELNRIYQRAIASIDREDDVPQTKREQWKEALRRAQRHWIEFKETDCDELMEYEWWGTNGGSTATTECFINKTVARTKELSTRYNVW